MSLAGILMALLVMALLAGLIEESVKHYRANKKWRGKE